MAAALSPRPLRGPDTTAWQRPDALPSSAWLGSCVQQDTVQGIWVDTLLGRPRGPVLTKQEGRVVRRKGQAVHWGGAQPSGGHRGPSCRLGELRAGAGTGGGRAPSSRVPQGCVSGEGACRGAGTQTHAAGACLVPPLRGAGGRRPRSSGVSGAPGLLGPRGLELLRQSRANWRK